MTDPVLERALALAKASKFGALGTIMRPSAPADAGFPFATLVAYALAGGQPLLLLSDLAEHTQNLRADPRASLLVAEDAGDEALARGRLTLVGRCALVDRAEAAPAYLALHPQAADYLALKDFHFWRLSVDSVRHVAGFGRMGWVSGEDWRALS
jgi:heme oxygenase (biliverdin-IX-beta and delta-forming)